jgi:hypothetical protein
MIKQRASRVAQQREEGPYGQQRVGGSSTQQQQQQQQQLGWSCVGQPIWGLKRVSVRSDLHWLGLLGQLNC